MSRRAVTDTLQRIALLRELLGEPERAVRPWGAAAWALRGVEGDFDAKHRAGELGGVRGVGPRVLEVVDAVMASEPVPLLEELEAQVPAGLLELAKLPGLGAKKIRRLWLELDITSVAELEYACHESRLVTLKGFGDKTQARLLEAIAEARATAGHRRVDQLWEAASHLEERIASNPEVERLAIGDAVELCVLADSELFDELSAELADAGASALSQEERLGLPVLEGELGGLSLRLWLCDDEDAWGAALAMTTGSAAHTDALRSRAARRGGALDGSGLVLSGARVACPTEDDLYAALGLSTTPVERREAHVPLVEAGRAGPRLLRRGDLVGALHNHTTASDGTASLEVMRAAAAERGLRYLGISEHSQSASYAGGLSPERLLAQREEIARLNEEAGGCVLLSGVESDILREGELDYDEEVLAALDVVIASVHRRHSLGRDDATRRLVRAVRSPRSHVLGHPTGRLLLGRAAVEVDMEAVLDACAETRTAVELNSHPARLDLCAEHLALAKARGVLVSIAADAHSPEGLDHLAYGVALARRAGLGPDDVLNVRPLEELRVWLARSAVAS
jgi:DNA polymerase (family 10)